MLNISKKSVDSKIDKSEYSVFKKLDERSISSALIKLLTVIGILGVFSLFLPWTQNIRSKGFVNTLNPYDKPQSIQSLIDGRIESWYVQEGDSVQKGDTILHITEAKEAYLDPRILERTRTQIVAKEQSAQAYNQKSFNLEEQYQAALKNRDVKLQQNELKLQQFKIKIQSDSMALVASKVKYNNAKNQLIRTQEMFDKGIKSLTDLETKRFAAQEAEANVILYENKLNVARNEIATLVANVNAIKNEYDEKLSKIQSERMSAKSMQYTSEGEASKLESQFSQYEVRSKAYYITSPIDGLITKAIKIGIGEFIKGGEDIISIIPLRYEVAVEMYVLPRDMPLLEKGQKVRILFDGWPAIVFSGWPENSYGTFGGKIFAIDNFIGENGRFRILVVPDESVEEWPKEVRVGGGANGLILLNEVPVYYEIWRLLNGFPPDYYKIDKSKNPKLKAPLRKVK